jgi:hypothetical protein
VLNRIGQGGGAASMLTLHVFTGACMKEYLAEAKAKASQRAAASSRGTAHANDKDASGGVLGVRKRPAHGDGGDAATSAAAGQKRQKTSDVAGMRPRPVRARSSRCSAFLVDVPSSRRGVEPPAKAGGSHAKASSNEHACAHPHEAAASSRSSAHASRSHTADPRHDNLSSGAGTHASRPPRSSAGGGSADRLKDASGADQAGGRGADAPSSKARRLRVCKSLRGALDIVRSMLARHSRCNYAELLRRHCPVGTCDDDEAKPARNASDKSNGPSTDNQARSDANSGHANQRRRSADTITSRGVSRHARGVHGNKGPTNARTDTRGVHKSGQEKNRLAECVSEKDSDDVIAVDSDQGDCAAQAARRDQHASAMRSGGEHRASRRRSALPEHELPDGCNSDFDPRACHVTRGGRHEASHDQESVTIESDDESNEAAESLESLRAQSGHQGKHTRMHAGAQPSPSAARGGHAHHAHGDGPCTQETHTPPRRPRLFGGGVRRKWHGSAGKADWQDQTISARQVQHHRISFDVCM